MKLRRILRWGAIIFSVPTLAAAVFAINLIWFKPFSLDMFYERAMLEFALEDPELLSSLRILEPMGLEFHNDDLTDASDFHKREMIELAKKNLAILARYDRATQTPSQILSTDVLAWFLGDTIRGEEFMYHDYPVNQMFGVQSSLPTFMATIHQVHATRDAENYIARLEKFGWKFNGVLNGLKLREAKGIIPPKFVIRRVLNEMRGFVEQPPLENILYVSFNEKLQDAHSIVESDHAELLNRVAGVIEDAVYPAYQTLIDFFTVLEEKATNDDGVWKLPNGDAYYAYVLRSNTTTDLRPAEVYNIGQKQVRRIVKEMRPLLKAVDMKARSVGTSMARLAKDSRYLYHDTEEGRTQCLSDYDAMLSDAQRRVEPLFDIRPEARVEVRRIPLFKELTSAGAYYSRPAMDGSRPGVFYVNLRDMKEVPTFAMRTLVYHEAVPGHHFQIGIQQELKGVPTLRKVVPFTAYTEGWALYAERLAGEHGFHNTPESELGRLQSELFRAVRLVVDTGLHYKRWSRQKAITYMEETTGMPHGDVVAEIERYIVMPGQACAYMIGMLKILELREKVKTALSDNFDLKAFHNVILRNGALPLELLERVVDRYIAEATRRNLAQREPSSKAQWNHRGRKFVETVES